MEKCKIQAFWLVDFWNTLYLVLLHLTYLLIFKGLVIFLGGFLWGPAEVMFVFWLGTSVRMIWLQDRYLFLCLPVSLWKDVTVNLKLRDIDAATDAKHRLEEKQRAEARERKEKEMQWETRVSVLMYTLMWRGNVPWEIMRSKYDSDKWSLIGSCCLKAACS